MKNKVKKKKKKKGMELNDAMKELLCRLGIKNEDCE